MTPRLWVTGLGVVTALGTGVEKTWRALVGGERAIRPLRLFDASRQRSAWAAEVSDVGVPPGPTGLWSRTSAMALTAGREAMAMAQLDSRSAAVGLVVGGTTSGMFETEPLLAGLHGDPQRRGPLEEMRAHPLTATSDRLEEELGPFSKVRTLSSACSSGANALVVAASWLVAGDVDVVVAGGSDGLCRLTLSGFNALGAIDLEPCRPFHRARRGTTLGEGAGFLVLERADRARARGAAPVAELAGWALGSEAHHITNPAADGVIVGALVARAIRRAGLAARDIDYINAHGTGTLANDSMEAMALARALGDEVARVPVSSSKGQIGHTLGAAGAIEAAITALVVARRTLVPTAGLSEPDPALRIVHVPHVGHRVDRVRSAVSNAFGFGGMATALVFTEPDLVADRRLHVAPGPLTPGATARGAVDRLRVDRLREELVTTARRRGEDRAQAKAPVISGAAVFGPWGVLGVDECAELLGAQPVSSGLADAGAHLDSLRARRLDRASSLATVAVERALRDAGAPIEDTGVVLGSAFGSVDSSAAFMHRVFERGPRAATPADFPNLVPSAPVGHVSIYLGLHGPAFLTADLTCSGESAIAQALDLVRLGESSRVVAGSTEPKNDIVERVLGVLFAPVPAPDGAPRTDLAAAVVVENDAAACERGVRGLARVVQALEWRADAATALARLRGPRGERAEVVLPRAGAGARELVARTPWARCPIHVVSDALGESEALGAVAVAVAVARIAAGLALEMLVVGLSRGRGYAFVLTAP